MRVADRLSILRRKSPWIQYDNCGLLASLSIVRFRVSRSRAQVLYQEAR
jgi:hypothetical protein